mmetsp:Transcript_45357/g.142232  ORF Transcript_45357/g.142232 Transcript_45357/m.142232 type:complete len:220 (-) Transcript_45357:148-807(-)
MGALRRRLREIHRTHRLRRGAHGVADRHERVPAPGYLCGSEVVQRPLRPQRPAAAGLGCGSPDGHGELPHGEGLSEEVRARDEGRVHVPGALVPGVPGREVQDPHGPAVVPVHHRADGYARRGPPPRWHRRRARVHCAANARVGRRLRRALPAARARGARGEDSGRAVPDCEFQRGPRRLPARAGPDPGGRQVLPQLPRREMNLARDSLALRPRLGLRP